MDNTKSFQRETINQASIKLLNASREFWDNYSLYSITDEEFIDVVYYMTKAREMLEAINEKYKRK